MMKNKLGFLAAALMVVGFLPAAHAIPTDVISPGIPAPLCVQTPVANTCNTDTCNNGAIQFCTVECQAVDPNQGQDCDMTCGAGKSYTEAWQVRVSARGSPGTTTHAQVTLSCGSDVLITCDAYDSTGDTSHATPNTCPSEAGYTTVPSADRGLKMSCNGNADTFSGVCADPPKLT